MTKTYELSNERMIMADVDEEHHTATVSVYVLDDLVKEANKADALDKIREEIEKSKVHEELGDVFKAHNVAIDGVLQIIDKYRG